MTDRNAELDRFKTEINLCEYACAVYGFELDKRSSSRNSIVLRQPGTGEKLVVTRRSNGHYVYFNTAGESRDAGSIIDLIQTRENVGLGLLRKKLRAWRTVDHRMNVSATVIELQPSKYDADKVMRGWVRSKKLREDNEYLVNARRLPSSILANPIFEMQIRTDNLRNVLFAYRDADGELTGYEIKNRSFTGFSPGGSKTLFQSISQGNEKVAVFCETAIDLLSLAAIFGTTGKQFFSTAGKTSQRQLDIVRRVPLKIPNLEQVWLAFDNDDAGKQMVSEFQDNLKGLDIGSIVPFLPMRKASDWNDELRSGIRPTDYIPIKAGP